MRQNRRKLASKYPDSCLTIAYQAETLEVRLQFDVLLDKAFVAAERLVSAFAAAAAGVRGGVGERAIWGGIAVHVCATRGALTS